MEALAPGQPGLRVAIMMEVMQVPACVGHELVITPPLSVGANNVGVAA